MGFLLIIIGAATGFASHAYLETGDIESVLLGLLVTILASLILGAASDSADEEDDPNEA